MKKKIDTAISVLILILVIFVLFVAFTRAQTQDIVATGGQYKLEKQVVAGGGNQMSQATMEQGGTGGQTVAGTRSTGGPFELYSGFWTPDGLAPTAATVFVSGRILTAEGAGIRNATVTATLSDGSVFRTSTGSLGYYLISEIPAGEIVVVEVRSKRFTFAQPIVVREALENIGDLDFIAN